MSISRDQYFMGRDIKFAAEMSPEIEENAGELLYRVNLLLPYYFEDVPEARDEYHRVNSGWRPPSYNRRVENAAPKSHHMTGRAIDIDDDEGLLDGWLMTPRGQQIITNIGLWMEHPKATPRWAHLQTVPPGSKRRVFYP